VKGLHFIEDRRELVKRLFTANASMRRLKSNFRRF